MVQMGECVKYVVEKTTKTSTVRHWMEYSVWMWSSVSVCLK